jgi:hypothetical protein
MYLNYVFVLFSIKNLCIEFVPDLHLVITLCVGNVCNSMTVMHIKNYHYLIKNRDDIHLSLFSFDCYEFIYNCLYAQNQ